VGDFGGSQLVELEQAHTVRAHRDATPLARALHAAGDRWTLLIVLACCDGTVRLNTLRSRLPGVSSAVLNHHVRQMVELGLLSRERFREMPPRVELTLTDSGAALLPIAAALARWGMRYRWDEHDASERVDADALLCQLPALLDDTKLPSGVLETVIDDGERPVVHRFHTVGGRLQTIVDPAADERKASALIHGDRAAWVAALGPRRDYTGLQLRGHSRLAQLVFDSLPR
jgi:DNA-binding HxlR family transcriptional regulator